MSGKEGARADGAGSKSDGMTADGIAGTPDIGGDRVEVHESPSLRAALRYAGAGLAVFALRPGAKEPYPRTRGCLDAIADPKRLVECWPEPNANVGVATGPASKLWVLDVDPRHGGDAALEGLIEKHGALPETLTVSTPSGGRHLWFRWPDRVELRNSAGRIGPGLDVRGEGGYVVASPSRLSGGGRYTWAAVPRYANGKQKGEPVIAEAPEWLIALAAAPERRFAEPIVGTIDDGQRNVALTSLAGSMRDRGCSSGGIYALLNVENRERCRPPLSDREVRAIVDSVSRYEPGKAWWAVGEAQDAAIQEWMLTS